MKDILPPPVLICVIALLSVPAHSEPGLVSAASPAWPWTKAQGNSVDILLMGDTNISHRRHPQSAYRGMLATVRQADYVFVNLEGPFAGGTDNPGARDIPHKDWRHSNPDQARALSHAGIDGVGVANNVTYPYPALLRSLAVLKREGLAWTGGGTRAAEARLPIIAERKGVRIGILQRAATVYPTNHAATENTPGIAGITVHTAYQPSHKLDKPGTPPKVLTWLDPSSAAELRADVEALAKKADVVITSFHWGLSGDPQPVSYQRDIAKLVIDAGADIVFGHGAHVYQPVEVYKGKPVFHGTGQGVFDDTRAGDRSRRFPKGLMVRVAADKTGLRQVSLVPMFRGDDDLMRLYDVASPRGKALFAELRDVTADADSLFAPRQHEVVLRGVGDH